MEESGDDYEESFCSDSSLSPKKGKGSIDKSIEKSIDKSIDNSIHKQTIVDNNNNNNNKMTELDRQMKELNEQVNNAKFLDGEMDLDSFLATHCDLSKPDESNKLNNENDNNNDDDDDDDDDDDNNYNDKITKSNKKPKKVQISIDKELGKKINSISKNNISNSNSNSNSTMKDGKGIKNKDDPSLAIMRDKYQKMLEIEKENAARVDALLATFGMMPKETTNTNTKGGGKVQKKSSPTTHTKDIDMNAKINSLLDNNNNNKKKPLSFPVSTTTTTTTTTTAVEDASSSNVGGGDSSAPKTSLEIQLKNTKKELKLRDERLQRMTEHNMLLTNQNESLKGEVAHLNMKLRSAEQELEAKEERVMAAMKAKKKAIKKSSQYNKDMEKFQELTEAYERLEEREQALLSAVEELSSQNQDLISKLKASMQRELDLSHVRASSVIQTTVNTVGASSDNVRRAQSDSSSDRHKKGKGKGKGGMLPDI